MIPSEAIAAVFIRVMIYGNINEMVESIIANLKVFKEFPGSPIQSRFNLVITCAVATVERNSLG